MPGAGAVYAKRTCGSATRAGHGVGGQRVVEGSGGKRLQTYSHPLDGEPFVLNKPMGEKVASTLGG